RCKFGSQCQNEHRGQPSYGGNSRYNNPQRSDIYDRISYVSGSTNNNKTYDERSVRTDLTKDRPIFRYSVYGPGKEEPNLVDGTDYSPEELRLQYYVIMGTVGNDIQYQNGVKDLENRTQTQIDSCLKDLRNSLNRFESQKQQKQQSSFEVFGSSGGAFGQPQPQGFGTPQNTFGASNTNQPSTFGTPGFGQNTIGFPETQQGFGTPMGGIGFGQNVSGYVVPTQTAVTPAILKYYVIDRNYCSPNRGNGHYKVVCYHYPTAWEREKPLVMKAYLANHCVNCPENISNY
ncbi:8520_t:CDS:2, partial [Dentiscutata erythropus]